MELAPEDRALIAALADGLALSERPYALLAQRLGWGEAEVMARLAGLQQAGVIRRFGVVVHHRELGYHANAMVVWDIPDAEVGEVGRLLAGCAEVTLCYRRPRRPPHWPYNLFTMVHGRDRAEVTAMVAAMAARAGVAQYRHELLFSLHRFKQCGARYGLARAAE